MYHIEVENEIPNNDIPGYEISFAESNVDYNQPLIRVSFTFTFRNNSNVEIGLKLRSNKV